MQKVLSLLFALYFASTIYGVERMVVCEEAYSEG